MDYKPKEKREMLDKVLGMVPMVVVVAMVLMVIVMGVMVWW